jgi:hypothetical protein
MALNEEGKVELFEILRDIDYAISESAYKKMIEILK